MLKDKVIPKADKYLKDDVGNFSLMRLMNLISLGAAIFIALSTLTVSKEVAPIGAWLTFMFLVGAFAPKLFQKIIELKMGSVFCLEPQQPQSRRTENADQDDQAQQRGEFGSPNQL